MASRRSGDMGPVLRRGRRPASLLLLLLLALLLLLLVSGP